MAKERKKDLQQHEVERVGESQHCVEVEKVAKHHDQYSQMNHEGCKIKNLFILLSKELTKE